ncbi:hypothetical protein [Emticicia agri]|uniref:Uncharacterized protein n=1 Tax=Emticicia agri TaxID=2492393 RepID=A0A4Q5LVP8_9BACT|nr:hypothetical protein [Emticicia agri]RYU93806.1 hypothetical protein EWM59_20000 [Emticicia agri]
MVINTTDSATEIMLSRTGEVYLYVDKVEDQYTKADILLVKYREDGIIIDNVILLETKISGSTEFTPRQKQSYRIIENGVGKVGVFELKSPRSETKLLNGVIFTDNNGKQLDASTISISKTKAFKISDTGLKNGTLNKSNIDTSHYRNFIAPDNK